MGIDHFQPADDPTKAFTFAGLAFFDNPFYNRLSHRLVQAMYWRFNKKDINEFRASISLPPLKHNILNCITDEKILNLYAISTAVIPQPGDWPDNSCVGGYLFLKQTGSITNPDDESHKSMTEFLQKGEPPVYIGMGSMPLPKPELFKGVISRLLAETEYRIIFVKGWSKIEDLPQDSRLLVLDRADHEQLLVRCKAAVIHGGVGTVATCLRTGLPMVIASVFGDQAWWGKLLQEKGLGFHIPFKKLTFERLERLLAACYSDRVKNEVNAAAKIIATEDGVAKAFKLIKKYFGV